MILDKTGPGKQKNQNHRKIPPSSDQAQAPEDLKKIPEHILQRFQDKPIPMGGCLLCKGIPWGQICPTATVKERREVTTIDRNMLKNCKRNRTSRSKNLIVPYGASKPCKMRQGHSSDQQSST
uniref:Uncharacterized protein n=1 Tax=Spongospora subterranea TaxID=70186 RepID=A0A0H5QZ74_9EUKA|eukprot:CRZ07235.1 hypothetical protein [Spongospora subterranea]